MFESDLLVDFMDVGFFFISIFGSVNICQKFKCNDQVFFKELGDEIVCVFGNKFDVVEEIYFLILGVFVSEQLFLMELGDEMVFDVESNIKMVDVYVILEKINLELIKNDSSFEIQFKFEVVNFVNLGKFIECCL